MNNAKQQDVTKRIILAMILGAAGVLAVAMMSGCITVHLFQIGDNLSSGDGNPRMESNADIADAFKGAIDKLQVGPGGSLPTENGGIAPPAIPANPGADPISDGDAPVPPIPGEFGAGFLWKPVSDSDGNLVVLLTPGVIANRCSVGLGAETENGREAGMANPVGGVDRQHWRFDNPGSAYGANVYVEAEDVDGNIWHTVIPDGGTRHP